MSAELGQVAPDVVLCGKHDPTGVFCQLAPAEVMAYATDQLSQTAAYRNFVLSSGCNVPFGAPLANLDAFYAAVKGS